MSEFVLGLALGIVGGFYQGVFAMRPKLTHPSVSIGSHAIPDGGRIQKFSLWVQNAATSWGVRARREEARLVHAILHDRTSGQSSRLRWIGRPFEASTEDAVIESGKQRALLLFGKMYQSRDYWIESGGVQDPLPNSQGKREFEVLLIDDLGREYRLDIIVENSEEFAVRPRLTWGMRRQQTWVRTRNFVTGTAKKLRAGPSRAVARLRRLRK